ncbi:MAG: type I secretion system permease/ATPase [Hyphomicrobiaceae bacterium]|nr:type I secretion system permease/ATPase [Hyphomicrobiaceae bacterium]
MSVQGSQTPPQPTLAVVLSACRGALIGIGAISFFTNLLMLTGPLFMLQIYDRVLTSRSVPTLVALLVLVAGLFAFMGVLELIRSRLLVRVGLRIDRILNGPVFDAILKGGRCTASRTSDTQTLRDLDQLRQFVSGPGPLAIFDMPWAPIYFAVIFMFHWWLGMVAVIGAAILLVLSLLNEFTSKRPLAEASAKTAKSFALAEAGRRNSEVLRAMGMADAYHDRWAVQRQGALGSHTQASDVAGTITAVTKVTRLFLQSLMLATGAYLALQQIVTPGIMIAASIILSRALAPIEQAVGNWRAFISARQGAKRIKAALETLPENDTRMALPEPKGKLSVSRLYAAPPGITEPVLKAINFKIEPGDALGVIGPSASGKSTLARALVGVWPALKGAVRLNRAALDQWDAKQLGRNIGYLPQDVELFDGTVEENIGRFDPDRDPEAIVAAAQKAGVHDLILHLSDGYQTQIGEGGAVLSAGQRQRVALARALYGDPVFVVLDEPNSNLDSDGECALTEAILILREEGCAVVVMAHRPSAIAAVNLLLVLRDGRQVGFGPKDEVLREHVQGAADATGRGNVRKIRRRSA